MDNAKEQNMLNMEQRNKNQRRRGNFNRRGGGRDNNNQRNYRRYNNANGAHGGHGGHGGHGANGERVHWSQQLKTVSDLKFVWGWKAFVPESLIPLSHDDFNDNCTLLYSHYLYSVIFSPFRLNVTNIFFIKYTHFYFIC